MKIFEIEAKPRPELGKNKAKKLRNEGVIPCVVYHKSQADHVAIDEKPLMKSIYTPDTYLYDVNYQGETFKAIRQSARFHPVHYDYLLDVEFLRVEPDRYILVDVPIELHGTSEGVLVGGKLSQKLQKLRVRGFYPDIPEKLRLDISHLKLGKSLKVGDLSFDKFQPALPSDVAIATVEITRALRQQYTLAKKGK